MVSPAPASAPTALATDVAGWYGMLAILAAYALNAFGVLTNADFALHALNLTGALGVAWVCWCKRTWQAFWLEAIWAAIATVALARLLFHA